MDDLRPLAGITHISQAQQSVIEHLWRATGKCCGCGKTLEEKSAKSCMGIVNTRYATVAVAKNTIGMGLYCENCTAAFSALMRQLRAPGLLAKTNGQN